MLLAAGFAALFMMQPQKAEAASATDSNYRLVLLNSRGEEIGATNLMYGNSGTAEYLGRQYCYWNGSGSSLFSSAHAVVSTLNEPPLRG